MDRRRGDVWWADLDPVRGHEQGQHRPVVIVSADTFNAGPSRLVIVCPVTRTDRRIRHHVSVDPPDGGLMFRSFVQCDQVRALSVERLGGPIGALRRESLAAIDRRLRDILDL